MLPIAIAIVSHPAFYNGLRHFIFVVPPFAVAGGLAFGWLFDSARKHGKSAPAALVRDPDRRRQPAAYDMVKLHPFEYTSFNALAGGVRQAQNNYMLDYWGLAFKQAADELRTRLDRARRASGQGQALDRGDLRAAGRPRNSDLGPQFETTFDDKQADFAMALGTFYCEHLNAPILVSIEREGVVYARVYDLRGGPTPNLLTEPPP